MITTKIEIELRRRLPNIVSSYGGVTNFISFVKESLNMPSDVTEVGLPIHSKAAMNFYLSTLLTYSNDVIMISPWSLFVDLRLIVRDGQTTFDSINPDEPYKVYTINGDLLYTVKNHFGAFGESRLDKNLIINSSNASMYFLKFKSYNGREQIRLLLVNMFSKRTEIANRYFRRPESSDDSTITFVNQTGLSINVYEVESSIMDTESFTFTQDQYGNVISPNNIITFNTNVSKYYYFDPAVRFERTVITNPLNDIVFEVSSDRLLFVGSNVDTTTLNKQFNTRLQHSNKPIQDIVTLLSI